MGLGPEGHRRVGSWSFYQIQTVQLQQFGKGIQNFGWLGDGGVVAAERRGGGTEIKWRDGCSGSLSVSLTATHSANRHLLQTCQNLIPVGVSLSPFAILPTFTTILPYRLHQTTFLSQRAPLEEKFQRRMVFKEVCDQLFFPFFTSFLLFLRLFLTSFRPFFSCYACI